VKEVHFKSTVENANNELILESEAAERRYIPMSHLICQSWTDTRGIE
jgi:hypothetical protein